MGDMRIKARKYTPLPQKMEKHWLIMNEILFLKRVVHAKLCCQY